MLAALVGEENIGPANAETFKDAVGLGRLIDKRLAIDYDASGFLNNVGSFNQVVSNEPVSVKKLYKDTHTRRLGVVVVRAYNAFISVPDGAEGLDRRMVVIPFQNPPKTIDTSLSEKLRVELSGIFAWCYQISDKEAKRRILAAGRIPAIAQACAERFEANNPELNFLVEQYQNGATSIKAGTLYKEYKDWCCENGHKPKSSVKFRPALENLGCQRSNKTCGCYFYTIPPMAKFDTAKHLGIDRTDKGTVEGQGEDSSTPCPEEDRDSCRRLKLQNFHDEDPSMELDSGEEVEPQLSTTIPKSEPATLLISQQPSPTVPSNYPHQNLKVGDRAVLVGDKHSRPLDEILTIWEIRTIQGDEATVSHPDFGNRKFDKSWLQVQSG